ncbi:MAG TPA: phage tail sheath subtilisin-like domain-containing protein, partial [Streptosporangiaceae bacterium]|nr:phage tail sheath subtilisin-like domain-containing protein [Streptosporangiaceae bacterium]
QFEALFGPPSTNAFLGYAVRGFFENGGLLCYVVRLDSTVTALAALTSGLAAIRDIAEIDLICAPDIMPAPSPATPPDVAAATALQNAILAECQNTGGRFAILDAVLSIGIATAEGQRTALASSDAAIYHPWIRVTAVDGSGLFVPPCGHVAGVFSRSDRETGVHKAPANETIDGVLDLRATLADDDIGQLYTEGVNCLRAFPGRGIRVWGARTLSGDLAWQSIGARRVFLTMGRWLEAFLTQLCFEPNDTRLWVRITREVTAYLDGLFHGGAFKGRTQAEAFFVKCDSETNPPDVIRAGRVVTIIGVALAAPAEFIVVRIIHGASGVSIQPATATTT